jgi:hypothetical protein
MSLNSGIFSTNIFGVKLENIYLFTVYESYAMINLKCIFIKMSSDRHELSYPELELSSLINE